MTADVQHLVAADRRAHHAWVLHLARKLRHHVHLAGAQGEHAGGGIGDEAEGDRGKERARPPVVVEPRDRDVICGAVLHEAEGARAHRRVLRIAPRRHDAVHGVHELLGKTQVAEHRRDVHGGIVHHSRGAGRDARGARPLARHPLEAPPHRLGGERRAIVEAHPAAQMEAPGVRREQLPSRGEQGLRPVLRGESHERLVDGGVHRIDPELRVAPQPVPITRHRDDQRAPFANARFSPARGEHQRDRNQQNHRPHQSSGHRGSGIPSSRLPAFPPSRSHVPTPSIRTASTGSSASRSPSPSRLNPITAALITSPG